MQSHGDMREPETQRVGKRKTPKEMNFKISFKVWKVRVSFEIAL